MTRKNELNPTRIVSIVIGAVALLGVIIIGSRDEGDSAPAPNDVTEVAPEEAPPPPPNSQEATSRNKASSDFASWVRESGTEAASEDSASDGGAAEADSGSDSSGEAASVDQPAEIAVVE